MPPRQPKPAPQRLPPMLRRLYRRSMTGCSKGARGLFVLSRVIGILTDTAISPSLRKRQLPSRYSIRAVRSFALRLTACLNLPAPGRSQCVYVGLDNAFAHTCVFAKQSLGTILCGRSLLPLTGHILPAPLIPKLRGNFAEFLFRKSLEHLRLLASPTCVGLRYGQLQSWFAKLFLAVCVGHP